MSKTYAPLSATGAIRFILGLFLIVGLSSTVLHYARKVLFLVNQGSHTVVQTANILKTPDVPLKNGLGLVQGYVLRNARETYTDLTSDLLDSVTYSYVLLGSDVTPTPQRLIIVGRKEVESTYSTQTVQDLPFGTIHTAAGVIGFHAHGPSKSVREELLKDFPAARDVVILDEGATVPKPTPTIVWFGLTLGAWVLGVILLIQWIRAVNKEYKIF